MVYNQFSFRQWQKWPFLTSLRALQSWGFSKGPAVTEGQRKAYDSDSKGQGAPETVFLSVRELRHLFHRFTKVDLRKENCDAWTIKGYQVIDRQNLLPLIGRFLGLDIYIHAAK